MNQFRREDFVVCPVFHIKTRRPVMGIIVGLFYHDDEPMAAVRMITGPGANDPGGVFSTAMQDDVNYQHFRQADLEPYDMDNALEALSIWATAQRHLES